MAPPKKKASPSNGLKQGTLFSFFKPAAAPTAATSTSVATKSSHPSTGKTSSNPKASSSSSSSSSMQLQHPNSKNNNKLSQKEKLLSQLKIGSSISVYWPDDNEYYNAKISSRHNDGNSNSHIYTLVYDDGDVEKNINLRNEDFKLLPGKDKVEPSTKHTNRGNDSSVISQDGDDNEGNGSEAEDGPVKSSHSKKRKIIHDSDEDEAEFDDDIEEDEEESQSDVSEFIVNTDDENNDDDDDVSMKMTDDDEDPMEEDSIEDDDSHRPKGKKKHVRVTTVTSRSNGNTTSGRASFITPPPKKKKTDSSSSKPNDTGNSFALFASGTKSTSSATSQDNVVKQAIRNITPVTDFDLKSPPNTATKSSKSPNQQSSASAKVPLPLPGTVNQAGTHFHNHYTFLQPHKRRDGKNRPITHPEYDHRTLTVDYREIERITKKLTPAQEQWWDIKSQYADTILLFKTGKFYEIFHMDADIAVQVLGFNYMKGQDAHAGFPEIAYGNFCDKLVKAGYKVARVEQTETPEMLNERKKKAKVGKKPKVVNREVCSIVTAGTRTFCYMDDLSCLEQQSGVGNTEVGPLLSIKEITIAPVQMESDEMQPVCEYGITLVDATTGTVTLGQFADDILRSRMNTLLTKYSPSEILVENGPNGASETLLSLINGAKNSFLPRCQVEKVNSIESFPKSNAVDPSIREKMERLTSEIRPWDKEETLKELHRRNYFPRASRKKVDIDSRPEHGISRWPHILKACIEGRADLAIASLGSALFYLQRNLIDQEILSMGIIKGYIPPEPTTCPTPTCHTGETADANQSSGELRQIIAEEDRAEDGIDLDTTLPKRPPILFPSVDHDCSLEATIDHLALDGTTIANLEILANSHSNTVAGSLWSKINYTKSPFGSRLLRAWLLRPLFRKEDIDRRADAVEELISGSVAAAMAEARVVLSKCGDMERLLSRVHSMGFGATSGEDNYHPNERAILYENATHTKRKVGDFSKLLDGLYAVASIPEIFSGIDIRSPLLGRIVRTKAQGGLFPSNLEEELDWFRNNFDCRKAAEGNYEPSRGVDEQYDAACDEIERIKAELEEYKQDMIDNFLRPKHVAKTQWKYANTKVDSKDKYLIELPISVEVPGDFIVKGKRGKGSKQVNKYRTPVVEQLVRELENAYDVMKAGKARGIQIIFSKFDSLSSLWYSASHASAILDALGALAQASSSGGFCRPVIRNCSGQMNPFISVKQGRHPCVDFTHNGGEFIPNDLTLGSIDGELSGSRILLLSGPNMGGKSTLLRQTCLIAILAQIGCFVPAEQCTLSPFDRIFTRLGASDRILQGQSTFFVELAETAAALRGATRRSLCIFDELGRGTSTFDGTAIASAAVNHLVEKNQCLALFATHYHSLLEEWKDQVAVRLGHMECFVDDHEIERSSENETDKDDKSDNITFLYTLGEGACPKSFGINVARLAGLPSDVLTKAKNVSTSFEKALLNKGRDMSMNGSDILALKTKLEVALKEKNIQTMTNIWERLRRCD